jgi:hypothetical protein
MFQMSIRWSTATSAYNDIIDGGFSVLCSVAIARESACESACVLADAGWFPDADALCNSVVVCVSADACEGDVCTDAMLVLTRDDSIFTSIRYCTTSIEDSLCSGAAGFR